VDKPEEPSEIELARVDLHKRYEAASAMSEYILEQTKDIEMEGLLYRGVLVEDLDHETLARMLYLSGQRKTWI